MIELQGVLKRFGALTAVDRVDLGIDEGERIVIIGPSGSGKTTLLRMVNFLETIDDGKILIDGREAGYRRDRKGRLVLEKQQVICALRSEIGMVFQHFHLFPHMTVLQNVMEGPVTVKKSPGKMPGRPRWTCSARSACSTSRTSTRHSCQAGRNSGSPSPGPWP